MDTFFSFIPGMSSRIGNHVDFPNYETDELVDIAKVLAAPSPLAAAKLPLAPRGPRAPPAANGCCLFFNKKSLPVSHLV